MNPEDFRELLRGHDWYYQMSDDPRIYQRGVAEAEQIRRAVVDNPGLKAVLDEFHAGH